VRRYVVDTPGFLLTATVVTINCPLHEKTKGLFNAELISKMKKGEPPAHPPCQSDTEQAPGSSTRRAEQSSSRKTWLRRSSRAT
jgi:hypothetical protein